MSKQSEAKLKQGYMPKAIPTTCCNCTHFHSDMVERSAGVFQSCGWVEEKNLRCLVGEFAVKKMGTCSLFQFGKVAV